MKNENLEDADWRAGAYAQFLRDDPEEDAIYNSTDIAAAQTAEVRRRIAQVESGEVSLIPGDEALAHVRRIVASARAAN